MGGGRERVDDRPLATPIALAVAGEPQQREQDAEHRGHDAKRLQLRLVDQSFQSLFQHYKPMFDALFEGRDFGFRRLFEGRDFGFHRLFERIDVDFRREVGSQILVHRLGVRLGLPAIDPACSRCFA
jgi:hypothetical protein